MNTAMIKQKIRSNEGNCLLYGCVSLVILGIIASLGVGFGMYYFYTQVRDKFTDDTPIELPVVEISDAERDAVIARVDTWTEALEEDGERVPLILTERDVNVLIQHHEDLEVLNGKVYVSINDSVITGEVSIPLDEIPGFSGRYFNGSADFEIELSNGRLSVYATAASVKGEPIPDEVMEQFSNENLAKNLDNDPDTKEMIEQIESIEVKDDVITIVPIAETANTPAEEEATAEN